LPPELGTLANKVPLYSIHGDCAHDFAIISGTLRVLSSDKPAAWELLRAIPQRSDDVATASAVIEGVAGPATVNFMLMFRWPNSRSSARAGRKALTGHAALLA